VEDLHLGYALVGTLAVALAAISSRMRDLPLSEPLLALLLGVLVGPEVLGLIDVPQRERMSLLLEVARVLLAVSLIGVALRYPVRSLRPVVRPTLLLVTVGMLAMAALTAGLIWLLLGVPVALAALIGACLTPTDPVLASSVVTGEPAEKDLPARLRKVMSDESGTNDGLALPLVLLGIALVLGEPLGQAVRDGLYQVLVGAAVGGVVGLLAGRSMEYAKRHSDIDQGASLVFSLVLAVAVLGIARVLGSDGVLAVFVAGLAYNFTVAEDEVGPQGTLDEGINRYLVLPLFLLLGMELPWREWAELGAVALLLAGAVLLLRRPPVVLTLARPLGLPVREALFAGWFGPIGVSAVFYLALAHHDGVPDPRLWAVGSLVVAASTLAHGVSSAPGRRLYRRVTSRRSHEPGPGIAAGTAPDA
jgi:NhaP-type Na+/H+ or K+/H+ antiporter